LATTAARTTEQEEQERNTRDQIGRALDELLQDDSKLGGQIAEFQEQLAPAEPRLDVALDAVLRGIQALPASLQPAEPMTAEHITALRELARSGSELSLARNVVTRIRARLVRKETERRDLRFQIAQLKQRLDQAGRSSIVDLHLWHEEADRLSSQIQNKLEALAPLSERISAHFTGGRPSLRSRAESDSTELTLG
jgi:chromosome segregation ATPase